MDRAFVRAKGGWDKWHDYEMTIAPYENGNHTCPVPWHRHSELSRGGDRLHAAPGDLNTYAAIAFGCPAMGKALAEGEMMPAADDNFSDSLRGLRLPNSLSEKAGTPLAVFLPCAVWRCLEY